MAKDNERFWRTLRMALVIGGILVSMALAYGALRNQVNGNTGNIEKHETTLSEHDKDIVELKTDVKYIREGVDNLNEKFDRQQRRDRRNNNE